ncbi:MerR family transcriptional regulator, partial [Paenibacillus agricola]
MKKTYKLIEIAHKLGKMRTTVTDWSNQYREFLPTIVTNGSLRYTEGAVEIFEIISKMRDANKSIKHIKDHLQEIRQKALIKISENEKPVSPNVHNLNIQLSKETMELRNVVQLLKQKLETNRQPKDVKDHLQDIVQKVTIASKDYGTLLSPIIDSSNIQLKYEGVSEEVAELRNVMQTLTETVSEIIEQDIKSELIAIAESLDTRYDGVSVKVIELGNMMQALTENVTEIIEQDIKSELTTTAELLNTRYDGMSEEVTKLRSVMQALTENVTEIIEQDIKSELTTTAELLNTRYDGMSEEVTKLR